MKEITAKDFDSHVSKMWMGGIHPLDQQVAVTALGLAGESTETMEKVMTGISTMLSSGTHAERIKKVHRGDDEKPNHKEGVGAELSDILFYVTNQARLHDLTLQDIMQINVLKLSGRLNRGTMRGDGDKR
ncbi:MAG: hypothetical protein GXP16_01450 [Gammaproteobacteria bacterium]|nr:hypothetical protein [Gammaproteobacteria bacterium]